MRAGVPSKMPWVSPLLDFSRPRMAGGAVALRGSSTDGAVASFDKEVA